MIRVILDTKHLVKFSVPNKIWEEYNFFQSYLYSKLEYEGRSPKAIDRISIKEFMDYVKEYLKK